MRGRRPADEPLHHPVERPRTARPPISGLTATQRTLRASIAARMPGTARIGWTETNGLLGAITIASAAASACEDAGGRP